MGKLFINNSELEAEKQDFLKTNIALLNQGISPEAAKGNYMALMEDSFE